MEVRKTGQQIVDFKLPILSGGEWHSRDLGTAKYTVVAVYRGMWCPHCKRQLQAFESLFGAFAERDANIVAMSADTQQRASDMAKDYGLQQLAIGYELPIEAARQMGLYISASQKPIEMPLFSEPGVFIFDSRGTLRAAWIASNAFARTNPTDVLAYIDFLDEHASRFPRGSD